MDVAKPARPVKHHSLTTNTRPFTTQGPALSKRCLTPKRLKTASLNLNSEIAAHGMHGIRRTSFLASL
jgi:hypothetical protein